jgi:hypothetical protein
MEQDAPVYWIDRCLGAEGVPSALRAIGVRIERYVDTYPTDPRVEDAVWIRQVTARGLVIVTKDKTSAVMQPSAASSSRHGRATCASPRPS